MIICNLKTYAFIMISLGENPDSSRDPSKKKIQNIILIGIKFCNTYSVILEGKKKLSFFKKRIEINSVNTNTGPINQAT